MKIRRKNLFNYSFYTAGILFFIFVVFICEIELKLWTEAIWRREINHDHDRYAIKPSQNYCSAIDYLIVVHTRQDDSESRDFYRSSYGKSQYKRNFGFKLLFPVGLDENHRTRAESFDKLKDEQYYNGDILLGEYLDTYRNLSLKQLSHLHYFSQNCGEKTSLLKVDDDVTWRMDKTTNLIKQVEDSDGPKMLCNMWYKMHVQKEVGSKWYVPSHIYNETFYPPYCSGMTYLANRKAVEAILEVEDDSPYFWIDDVFITGFLAGRAGVKMENIGNLYKFIFDNGSSLELGATVFQLGPKKFRVESFKKSMNGMKKAQLFPLTYYCDSQFCEF